QIGEVLAGPRAGQDARHVEHPDVRKRSCHGLPFGRKTQNLRTRHDRVCVPVERESYRKLRGNPRAIQAMASSREPGSGKSASSVGSRSEATRRLGTKASAPAAAAWRRI